MTWREALFSLKTFAAAMLAVWIALRLDLPQPTWAMLTVYIVSQPLAGMVLSKALFRVVGTFVGAAMALLLVGLFADVRELFIAALATWIGACTFTAVYLRDVPAADGALLSGYTAATAPGLADRRNLVADAVTLETLRAHAVYDTPEVRRLERPVRLIQARLLTLLATLVSIQDRRALLRRERPARDETLRPRLERVAGGIRGDDAEALEHEIAAAMPSFDEFRHDHAAILQQGILLRLRDVSRLWHELAVPRAHGLNGPDAEVPPFVR